eukprot:gene15842-biopygen7965
MRSAPTGAPSAARERTRRSTFLLHRGPRDPPDGSAQHSPAHPGPAQPSPAQPSSAQPGPAQLSPAHRTGPVAEHRIAWVSAQRPCPGWRLCMVAGSEESPAAARAKLVDSLHILARITRQWGSSM